MLDPLESVEEDELSALELPAPLTSGAVVDGLEPSVGPESLDVRLPFPAFEPLWAEELLRESVL